MSPDMQPFQPLDVTQLAGATGGIFYNERKSPTGERWAAAVDRGAKSVYDAVSPYAGRNVTGLALLAPMAVGEFAARKAGAVKDLITGERSS
jgi:hypothetical protein